MTTTEMTTRYNAAAAAHTYALGFIFNHVLYVATLTFEQLSRYFKADRAAASKGGFLKVRIRMTAADRAELAKVAEMVGPEALLTLNPKYNKGENFERELTERWTSEVWTKDSVPFTVAGDIRVNGVEIQVKLDGAELTNERAIAHLTAA